MNELPKGWAEGAAGELCVVVGGATPRTDTDAYWGGDIPWVTPDDLSKDRRKLVEGGRRSLTQQGLESCAATLVPDGTVLFTSRAPIGYVAIASRPVATNQGFKSLTPSKALTSDFLYWQLQHLTEMIRGLGSGTTFAEVSKKVMATVPLRVAPIAEQERIVAAIEEAFSKLDVGEAGLRTVRQLLKRMRDAILTAAVTGRLVPPSGDNAYEDRKLESLRDGSAPGLDRRTRRLRDSDVAPPAMSLPPGWRWVRWSQVGRCQNGRAFPSADYCDDGVPLLRPGNLAANGQVSWTVSNTRYLPEHYTGTCPDLVVGPSEVVMNLTAQSLKDDFLGRVCITGPNDRCLLNQRLARLTPFAVTPTYAVLFFRSHLFREFVKTLNSGSLIQHMYTHQVDSCWMPLPPPADQDAVVVEVDRNLSVIDSLQAIVDAAGERSAGLRRSVLKAAFDGRLVPQDPSDEPASVLLDRIRAERSAQPVAKRRARQTA